MARNVKLVASPEATKRGSFLHWSLCVLCQADTKSALVDPTNVTVGKGPSGQGYKILADNLTIMSNLKFLPMNIYISRFDDGAGMEETFLMHHAKWHKACYVQCNRA